MSLLPPSVCLERAFLVRFWDDRSAPSDRDFLVVSPSAFRFGRARVPIMHSDNRRIGQYLVKTFSAERDVSLETQSPGTIAYSLVFRGAWGKWIEPGH